MKLKETSSRPLLQRNLDCFLLILLFILPLSEALAQCNGSTSLCDRRYNEVAYLTTHNAFNCSAAGFQYPNQNHTLTDQLHHGVRALMLDVHDLLGVPTVYHGTFVLGSQPFASNLNEIKAFLDSNSNEVVTIILECYVSANAIETSVTNAGLMPYVFAKDTNTPWPTLQDMISSGKRLVVFTDVDDASPAQDWYHYVWNFAVETNYTVSDTSGFTSNFNRGDSLNEFFILNHFVTNALLGYGSATDAAIANSNPFFMTRVNTCMAEKNKFPNFVTVDFYELGDAMTVVNTLNGMDWYGMPPKGATTKDIIVYPNPATDHITIGPGNNEAYSGGSVKIFNLAGQEVMRSEITQLPFTLSLPDEMKSGMYLIELCNNQQIPLFYSRILKCSDK